MRQETSATAENNAQQFFPAPSESITIQYGVRKKLLTLTLCKNTIQINSLSELQKNNLNKIPNIELLEAGIYRLPNGINLSAILASCNIEPNEVMTHVFSREDELYIPTGKFFVDFNETATREVIEHVLQQYGLSIVKFLEEREFFVVCFSSSNPMQIAYELQQNPHIKLAEPEFDKRAEVSALAAQKNPPAPEVPKKPWIWGQGMEPSQAIIDKYDRMPSKQFGIVSVPIKSLYK